MRLKSIQITILFSLLIVVVATITNCSQPQTEIDSEPKITCSKCPRLEVGQDTLEFVLEARRFVTKISNSGLIGNHLNSGNESIFEVSIQLDSVIHLLESKEATTSCKLSAKMLAAMLASNGIPAYIYSFGFQEKELGHSVTIAKVGDKYIYLDPNLSYTIVNEMGDPADFLEVLKRLRSGKTNIYTSADTTTIDVLVNKRLASLEPIIDSLLAHPNCANVTRNEKLLNDSIVRFKESRCFLCDKERCFSFIKRFETELRQRTAYTDYHQGLLIKTGTIQGSTNASVLDSLVNAIINKTGQ